MFRRAYGHTFSFSSSSLPFSHKFNSSRSRPVQTRQTGIGPPCPNNIARIAEKKKKNPEKKFPRTVFVKIFSNYVILFITHLSRTV